MDAISNVSPFVIRASSLFWALIAYGWRLIAFQKQYRQNIVGGMRAGRDAEASIYKQDREENARHETKQKAEPLKNIARMAHIMGGRENQTAYQHR